MFQSLLVAEIFGVASFGTVLGMVMLFSQVLGGLGPLALGALAEGFGAYQPGIRGLVVRNDADGLEKDVVTR